MRIFELQYGIYMRGEVKDEAEREESIEQSCVAGYNPQKINTVLLLKVLFQ
jgi:hypothetical protein